MRIRELVDGIVETLFALPRRTKRLIMLAADLVAISYAILCAVSLVGGVPVPEADARWLYLAVPLTTLPVFAKLGLYRAVVRYTSGRAISPVVSGVGLSAAVLVLVNFVAIRDEALPRVLLVYSVLAYVFLSLSRHLARVALEISNRAERIAIYGTGDAAVSLLSALRHGRRFKPVALLDDNPNARGTVIAGLEVRSSNALEKLAQRSRVTRVLLAVPAESRERRRAILARLEAFGVAVQSIPDAAELAAGRARVDDVRELDLADLLGRDPVPPDSGLLGSCLRGKSVLVTGAGGSIGSELCRQILQHAPSRLVLVEVSEAALYTVEKELRRLTAGKRSAPEIVGLLSNCQHRVRMSEIMKRFRVHTVYHAAAYKHVPIVEENMIEGIRNNVFGSWQTAEAALEARVESFVLVSTDKAVYPTNVMGATKRLAELVLQGLDRSESTTRFCMVRFGNVIASSGSVIPLFQEQIRSGGPVTVTHPEITRYFMTAQEAANLVIQAGSMATGGDVFVLDMGAPVRIDDLARRVIHLMGFTVRDAHNPDGEIEIAHTGLRPAEKLYEELLIGDNVIGTQHPMIMRVTEHSLAWEHVEALLDDLRSALDRFDCRRARVLLCRAVEEYQPDPRVHDLVSRTRRTVETWEIPKEEPPRSLDMTGP